MKTQNEKIIWYLTDVGPLTQLDAMKDLGIARLASRINELRNEGYQIESTRKAVKNRFGETCYIAEYRLEK